MRFFNAQNHRSGYGNPVFLNITDKDCKTFEFREEIVDDTDGSAHYDIVTNDSFIRARNESRFINYAYAGGVNKCNYNGKKTVKNGKIYLTFTLAKTLHPSIPYSFRKYNNIPLWDFGHAVFKNGSPVIAIELAFSEIGELIYSTFTSLYDINHNGYLIRFLSTSDGKDTQYFTPDQVISSENHTLLTWDMAFSYQNPDTDVNLRAVKGLRRNIDTVSGGKDTEPVCWFLENEYGEYMSLVMVLGITSVAWDMNQTSSQGFSYCKWYSDDNSVSEYKDATFPGYKGLDI